MIVHDGKIRQYSLLTSFEMIDILENIFLQLNEWSIFEL